MTLYPLALVITFALFAVRALLAPRPTQPRQQDRAREGGEGVGDTIHSGSNRIQERHNHG